MLARFRVSRIILLQVVFVVRRIEKLHVYTKDIGLFSILYQSPMNKGGINSDNQVLQMTLSL